MEASMVRSNVKSSNIIENIKNKKLIDIFRTFDSDGDGVISSTKIDISSVDTTILEAFAPLLCEMEELNQTLTIEEFLEAADRLLRSLSIDERDRLLLGKKLPNFDHTRDLTFKPQINKNSAKIANTIRPYGDSSLYDVYLQERKEFMEKISEEKERKMDEEMRECSFKPHLISTGGNPMISLNAGNYRESGLY